MKKILTFFLFLALNAFLFAQVFEWEWQNPKPVGNTFNDAVSLGLDNAIAVGQASIVHRTDDGGVSWETLLVDGARREIESVNFPTSLVGYVAGHDGLIKKTTDGGLSWSDANSPTTEDLYAVAFVDADTGYIAGASGAFFKTTDGGATWNGVTAPMTNTIYALHVIAANNIFVGTSSASAAQIVSQSTDYGATWNNLTGPVANSVYDIDFLDANYGWLGCSSGKVFITTDGGANFTESIDFGSSGNYRVLIVDALNGYVVDSGGDVHKTADGGASWTSTTISTESLRGCVMANTTSEAVDQIYIFGNYGTALKSTDDGATWNPIFEFLYQELQRQIRFVDNQKGYVSGGSTTTADNLGYMLVTTNGGQTWADIGYNFTFQVYSFDIPAPGVIYAGTGNNKMFKTTNDGLDWAEQTSPISSTTHDFYQTRFGDVNTGYAAGTSGRIIKTTDGGANWTEITSGHGTSTIYDMYVFDPQTLIAVGASAKAFKSTDGGGTWTQLFPGIPGTYFSINFYEMNTNIGYIAGYDSPTPTLSRTTDGGDTWNPVTLPTSFEAFGSVWGIGIVNENIIWMTEVNGNIVYSNDAGLNWSVMNQVSQNGLYGIAIQGIDMWLCGAGGTILKGFSDPAVPVELVSFSASVIGSEVVLNWSTATETNNLGFEIERKTENTNWEKLAFVPGKGTTTQLSSYTYKDKTQLTGNIYYRLKQIDQDGTTEYSNVVEINIEKPLIYSLEQNYPNPFNPTTTIKFSIPEAGTVTLKVYDLLGNEIATLVDEVKDTGIHTYEFDASNLSSGVYFYELVSGNFKNTKKMLILK